MDVDHGSGSVKYCCSSPSITTLDRQVRGADCFQCGRSDEFIVLFPPSLPPSKICRLGFRYWDLKADSNKYNEVVFVFWGFRWKNAR